MNAKLKVIMSIEETDSGYIKIIESVMILSGVSAQFKLRLYNDFGIDLDDEHIKKVTIHKT